MCSIAFVSVHKDMKVKINPCVNETWEMCEFVSKVCPHQERTLGKLLCVDDN